MDMKTSLAIAADNLSPSVSVTLRDVTIFGRLPDREEIVREFAEKTVRNV
jgi:hypothetical protein